MTDWTYDATEIYKQYYIPGIQEQLNNATVLAKHVKKNTKDLRGNQAEISVHKGRNPGVGARYAGGKLPKRGKQSHDKTYVDLKFNYARCYIDGPTIEKTKGDRAAFASAIDVEMQGLARDMEQECNRQKFGDGTGFLCLTDGTSATGTTGNTIVPYLWSTAGKYIVGRSGLLLQGLTISNWTDLDPDSSDTDANGILPTDATTTQTKLYWTTSGSYSPAQGDGIGIWRNVQDASVRYEMMGIDGIVHDSDLPGDYYWYYNRDSASQTFTNAEIEALKAGGYTFAVTGITNNLQSIDAQTNSFWRAKVNGNGGAARALALTDMDDIMDELETTQGVSTDLIITTGKVKNKYIDLLRSERRYVNTMTIDGGFSAVEYMGKPLVADKDCPRGRMYFLNLQHLQLYVGMEFDMVGGGSIGEYLHYIENYDSYESILRYYAELGTTRRNAHAKLIDISEV